LRVELLRVIESILELLRQLGSAELQSQLLCLVFVIGAIKGSPNPTFVTARIRAEVTIWRAINNEKVPDYLHCLLLPQHEPDLSSLLVF
jgi:hypothetical protein